jgi:tRNA-dihydrouridine synthase 3
LKQKPEDIGETCYIYSTKGFCHYGITCRFAKNHVDENFKNLVQENTEYPDNRFHLPFELQTKLRKKTYDFSKAEKILKDVEAIQRKQKESQRSDDQKIGDVFDTDTIKLRPSETKKVCFKDKLLLAPLTTVGNLPFRRICKEFGVDITCGEMACAIPIVNGQLQEWALTKRHESEDIFGVQLCSHASKLLAFATQVLNENIDVDFIDLNIGCPIDLIYNQGGGSALMRRPQVLETIVRSCSTLLESKPFTVKVRTGIYSGKNVAHELVPKMEEWGASAITVHGRTKEQRYTKSADWKYIQSCAETLKKVPLIGNGDIICWEDYMEVKKVAPSVSSVMIGRGALIKPWIFKEIKEQKPIDISSQERFELLKKYVNYGLEHWGSDTKGVETTRRFLLEWLSFFYRYVPYGIIVNPPQKINQRPECDSFGRDDLEVLLASSKSTDWIKIR